MVKCIKFNKFNVYFKYILLTILFRYFNICILGYNHNDTFEPVNLNKFIYDSSGNEIKVDLSNFKMTEFFFYFIGIFILSIISRIFELHSTGNNIKKFFQIDEPSLDAQRKLRQLSLDALDITNVKRNNILHTFKNYLVNNSSFFIYIIISFIWVVQEILNIMFSVFLKDIDYWFFEILIVTIIFSNIFLVEVYKHQKLAIAINLIPCIFKTITIILRFNSDEPTIYTEYPWWIPVGFICYLILITISAFINCSIKSFIDLKYTTIGQLLIFYSFVGIVVCTITCIINTFVPCSKINNPNFVDTKMCKVEYNDYLFFDNFKKYFSSFSDDNSFGKLMRSLIIILDFLSSFFKEYFYILVIKYMGPVHITLAQPIFFFLKKIVLIINNLVKDKAFFKDTFNYKPARFFLDMGGDIVCITGFLIYFEIIELNCFNLNYNLRKNIIRRGDITDPIVELKMIDEPEDVEEMTSDFGGIKD